MPAQSLRGRVLAAGLVVIATALVGANAAVWFAQAAALERHLDDVVDERIELVLDAAEDHAEHTELAAALGARGIRAVVVAPDGTEHATEAIVPRVGQNLPRPPGTDTPALHVRSVPLPAGGEVQVAVSRDGVDATLRRLLWLQLLTALITLPVAALLLHRSTRVALRPLDTVVDTANAIAEGDLSQRLRPGEPDTEIGQGATAFDRMLDALEAAIRSSHASEETTRRFLERAAHQLRTPVTAASASVQALLLAPPRAEHEDLLLAASRETARAGRMVNDLLRLAQLDEGLTVDPRATDLGELVETETARASRRAPHLSITHAGTDSTPPALADPDLCAEIVANLLDNATRHADQQVAVRLASDDRTVTITVHDDGPGVPHQHVEHIFERFVTLGERQGTGLGLPIARELARAQHGTITYDGDAFAVVLPRANTG